MEAFLANDGHTYGEMEGGNEVAVLFKELVEETHRDLATVDDWLTRRAPSKALDTVYAMRITVGSIAEALIKGATPECVRASIAKRAHLRPHLIRRACREVDVDYAQLLSRWHTVCQCGAGPVDHTQPAGIPPTADEEYVESGPGSRLGGCGGATAGSSAAAAP
jgi:hypothetical protein